MAPNPILNPKVKRTLSMPQDPAFGISRPLLFGAVVALLLAKFDWAWRWLTSGAPMLTFAILFGASQGYRVLPFVPLWTLLPTLNLAYAIASTSWLLHGAFVALCYPLILIVGLFQSSLLANLVRGLLRRLLTNFQFANDTIAFFGIPALEIDTEVEGLMVIRGITLSFSNLTLVAHGVEVGIKLSDDMELALQAEIVTIELFRRITISPVYANLKGGQYEMTFGNLDKRAGSANEESFMVSDSALLQRASTTGTISRPPLVKMTSRMTKAAPMKDTDSKNALKSITKLAPDNEKATEHYESTVKWIEKTSSIRQCRQSALELCQEQGDTMESENEIRAAISTMLHSEPSIPHPPTTSVRVTTLRKLSSPRTKRILHRLPMLLRLLLNPLSYFHPVKIETIVAAGSGQWITAQLEAQVFKNYASDNAELRRLQKRVSSWLSDANFVVSLENVRGQATVPFLAGYDVICYLTLSGLMAYRTLHEGELRPMQVVHVGGADATFSIPSFLLPHHEHILPPKPSKQNKSHIQVQESVSEDTGKQPEEILDEDQAKDEANIQLSVHARLPATFDQELLNFTAALVKATKVVELEKEADAGDHEETSAFRELAHSLNRGMKDSMKKVVAEGIVNDRWIAKMVGKIMKRLQTAQGEVGYSGMLPVELAPYRLPDGHVEANKILE